jgi:inner membrane protein
MDPLTHTMTGAAMARAGLDRRTPLAAATLMLAANAPDIDIVSVWVGSYASIAFRRGWTHGPIALVVLPFIVTALILAWDRFVRQRRVPAPPPVHATWTLALASIGVVSHPALDWLNTYGIRLLMPFSERWFYGDTLFIVDPWVWVMLATALVLARKRATQRAVRVAAGAAVVYTVVMLLLSRSGSRAAADVARAAAIDGVTEVLYQPAPLNPLRAELIAVTPQGYHRGELQWLRTPRVRFTGDITPRGDWSSAAVVQAQTSPDAADYLVWSRYPYARVEPDGAVYFGDARFPEGGITGGLGGVRVAAPPR